MPGVAVVGGGTAGAELVASLRRCGYSEPVMLIGEESHLPYQRPPLSKSYLKEEDSAKAVAIRPEGFYAQRGIETRIGARAVAMDRTLQEIVLADGSKVHYDHLVLATGSRNRSLELGPMTFGLRTVDDAEALRSRIVPGSRVVLVGGGFIGLELAAAASTIGAKVLVVELLDRLMTRAVSPILSEHLRSEHEAHGVEVRLGCGVASLDGESLLLSDGERVQADCVVVGIGAEPNVDLATAAELEVDQGVMVDEFLRTADPHVSAIGDCARFPCRVSRRVVRLESVQNATDHARYVAARLTGKLEPYAAVPWFWTEQFGRRIQIAGLAGPDDEEILCPAASGPGFSVCRFAAGRLVAVESIDSARDHVAARKLLAEDVPAISAEQVAGDTTSLPELASLVAR